MKTLRNDARPIGVDRPASPVGGPPSRERSGEAGAAVNRATDEEPKREEPPEQRKPEQKEPQDPTMPSDDPTIRTQI